MSAVERVVRAWTNPGATDSLRHQQFVWAVRYDWPALAAALDDLAAIETAPEPLAASSLHPRYEPAFMTHDLVERAVARAQARQEAVAAAPHGRLFTWLLARARGR